MVAAATTRHPDVLDRVRRVRVSGGDGAARGLRDHSVSARLVASGSRRGRCRRGRVRLANAEYPAPGDARAPSTVPTCPTMTRHAEAHGDPRWAGSGCGKLPP